MQQMQARGLLREGVSDTGLEGSQEKNVSRQSDRLQQLRAGEFPGPYYTEVGPGGITITLVPDDLSPWGGNARTRRFS